MAVPPQDPGAPPGMVRLVPAAAAFLGLLFPGGGHIYCGQRRKGTIILVIGICTGFFCGLMNLWAAWASWRLARRLRFAPAPPHRRGGGGGLGDVAEAAGDLFD